MANVAALCKLISLLISSTFFLAIILLLALITGVVISKLMKGKDGK